MRLVHIELSELERTGGSFLLFFVVCPERDMRRKSKVIKKVCLGKPIHIYLVSKMKAFYVLLVAATAESTLAPPSPRIVGERLHAVVLVLTRHG
jgi:hypothetical protein